MTFSRVMADFDDIRLTLLWHINQEAGGANEGYQFSHLEVVIHKLLCDAVGIGYYIDILVPSGLRGVVKSLWEDILTLIRTYLLYLPVTFRPQHKAHEIIASFPTKLRRSTARSFQWAGTQEDSREIKLPEDDPDTFRCYTQWVYCKTIPVQSDNTSGPDIAARYMKFVKAYILGDKLLDDAFKNAVLRGMIATSQILASDSECRIFPSSNVIWTLYEGTLEGSRARLLFVDFYTWNADESWETHLQTCPAEFLFDLAISSAKDRPRPGGYQPWERYLN
ncbi:hypothetical protein BU16DRAFT_555880 [Lophium mytilinum]|uniref:BTB domain-containing protein n=1 Tax=Lophium mytilinum TaxID=390894 RepID=A0A6A6RAH0_9PEZI|nr:hypothetical protein BU16DRAFT_555880 [Lophium mytilinum]